MPTKFNNLKKNAFLAKMDATLGNITISCKEVGIDRSTYYKWLEKDPKFRQAVDDLAQTSIDFAESMLKKNMKEGDTTAIIFFLKTKGRSRGYSEKQELELTGGVNVNADISIEESKRIIRELEQIKG